MENNNLILSGHQPAYLPWLGYFHKMLLSDIFIYMDDVQFIERGFIHRNKIKVNPNTGYYLSLPISKQEKRAKKKIKDIFLTGTDWQKEHFEKIYYYYHKADNFKAHQEFLEEIYLSQKWANLNDLCLTMLKYFIKVIGIDSKLIIGSEQNFREKKSNLILEHCKKFNAKTIILGKFGADYLVEKDFESEGIRALYQNYIHPVYQQRFSDFLPYMSILDLILNVKNEKLKEIILSNNLRKEDIKL